MRYKGVHYSPLSRPIPKRGSFHYFLSCSKRAAKSSKVDVCAGDVGPPAEEPPAGGFLSSPSSSFPSSSPLFLVPLAGETVPGGADGAEGGIEGTNMSTSSENGKGGKHV